MIENIQVLIYPSANFHQIHSDSSLNCFLGA